MKIIFMGTPHYAEVVLEKLINSRHQVVAVVCNPDKPVGRKQVLTPPPTKLLAQKYNIPVYQFKKIRIDGVETLKKIDADIMITAAYGQILSQEILDITKFGVYNVHGSVLPKYRGSSPIQWSLINGEKKLGVTILKTLAGLDNGPILLTQECDILPQDTVESLMHTLSSMGGDLLLKGLDMLESGNYNLISQNEAEMTYYPMLKKEMSPIDFNKTAQQVCNFVRGMAEWPVATVNLQGNITKVYRAEVINYLPEKSYNNGDVVCASNKLGLVVKTADGFVRLAEIQPQNSKRMKDTDYLNGKKVEVGVNITDKKI
ncbi:MAG: methionyl-tRNA formyltransferase [Christensenellales bacterium]